MRLLNTTTLRLELFSSDEIPDYAILSHKWGSVRDEVLFDDIKDESIALPISKPGFVKLRDSCSQAARAGYKYIWIDTCCIDKSSSAELSEAINSMFKWYRQSKVCYAFLEDVQKRGNWEATVPEIRKSEWFARGWTLQELIAPPDVHFYSKNWSKLGTRNHRGSMALLADITGISGSVLNRNDSTACDSLGSLGAHILKDGRCVRCHKPDELTDLLETFSIAQKMAWARGRETTRIEDRAYCLLGLFNVNMPLLYGEGVTSFTRLQEEIIRKSDDQSILAYEAPYDPWNDSTGLLAISPSFFTQPNIRGGKQGEFFKKSNTSPIILSTKWISLRMYLCPCTAAGDDGSHYSIGILDCAYGDDFLSRPGLILSSSSPEDTTFSRVPGSSLVRIDPLTAQGSLSAHTEFETVHLNYDLRDARFDGVNLLLLSRRRPADIESAHATSPPLRLDIRCSALRCMMAYPSSVSAGTRTPYFPADKDQGSTVNRRISQDKLCGIFCFGGEGYGAPFFVLWGVHLLNRAQLPWEMQVRPQHGSPWCRIVSWKIIMGEVNWPESESEIAHIVPQFSRAATGIMKACNGSGLRATSGSIERGLVDGMENLAVHEVDLVDLRSLATGLDSGAGECVRAELREVLFLGRVLLELVISQPG